MFDWLTYSQADPTTQADLLQQTAVSAPHHLPTFQHTLDMLAYHGRSADSVTLLQQAWPHLSTSPHLTPRRQQEFAAQIGDTLIFHHLAQNPTTDPASAAATLLPALQPYFPIDQPRLADYIAMLSGHKSYPFAPHHLITDSRDTAVQQQAAQNLTILMLQFIGHTAPHPIPRSRTNLLRRHLPVYLVERRTGQLEPRTDMTAVLRGQKSIPTQRPQPHPLCPDETTLQQYLSKLLNYDPQPYPAAALYSLLPTWLHFLQSLNLITPAQQQATQQACQPLGAHLTHYFATHTNDPALPTAVTNW
jgi:hypothetical protein